MARVGFSVGASAYDADLLQPLRYSVRDAVAIHEILTHEDLGGCDPEASVLLIDPTKAAFERAFEGLVRTLSSADTLIFFFAGHGLVGASGELLLCGVDADPTLPYSSAIRLSLIESLLDETTCRSASLLFDCCYGGAAGASLTRAARTPANLLEQISGRGRIVISASGRDQVSREADELGHGVFTAGVLEGVRTGAADLDGDGMISHNDLFRYVDGWAARFSSQRPTLWGADVTGDLFLARNPRQRFSEVTWAGDTRPMRRVAAGSFLRGTHLDETSVDEFLIDTYPVTNGDFEAYVMATGAPPPRHWAGSMAPDPVRNHPVVFVNFPEAASYARWAGKRLPTEVEWEKAARGPDGFLYPWGNALTPAKCNSRESGIGTTSAVDRFRSGVSPFGVFDMSGNVWEWCCRSGGGEREGLRGGSFNSPFETCMASDSNSADVTMRDDDTGFRCAADA